MKITTLFHTFAIVALGALPTSAQQPDTLLHSIPAPIRSAQSGAQLGYSLAVDGGLTVVGSPYEDLHAEDSGAVRVYDSATGALRHTLGHPSPARNDHFGESVAISGTRVVVGASRANTGKGEAGSAYIYDLASPTPTVPVATLHNPGPVEYDLFGCAVGISGTRVVVGASWNSADNSGSAYVYDLVSATPTTPVATLNNPSPGSDDRFGSAVAISGARVVVGVPWDDATTANDGSAYVYDLASASPTTPVVVLNNPFPGSFDSFAYAVAISGSRVLVSEPFDDTGAIEAGRVFVYDLASATPATPSAILNNPSPAVADHFGISVSVSGTWVVAGADLDNAGASDAGSAYVYDLASATPTTPVATLNNPNPASNDNFGCSVAVSGARVVVGAYRDDTGATDAGSAYVYDLASATPTVPSAMLNTPGPAVGDNFGGSVAISGTRVVAGAAGDDTGAHDAGSVHVYDLACVTPTTPVATLNNPSPASDEQFGSAVAISGALVVVGGGSAHVYDLTSASPTTPVAVLSDPVPFLGNGFGRSVAISDKRVVVGAYNDNTGASGAGSAYVYNLASATPTTPVATLHNPSPANGDRFGSSVAISGTRVVVGAYSDDTGEIDAGSAYVYDLASATPTVPVATLNNPSPGFSDYFGDSVAVSGTRVVVGAPLKDTVFGDAGSAYVYDLASATPAVPVATFENPNPAPNDFFGYSVAIADTRVVVGAHWDHSGAAFAGSAYAYDLSTATPTIPIAVLNHPNAADYDLFGNAVAIDGTTAVIGAVGVDGGSMDRGAAYIFTPADPDFDGDGLLDIWEHARFGSISTHTALDDTDQDGRNELLELAFDADPTVSDLWAAPAVTSEGGFLTMTIQKRAGVSYLVETASSPDNAAFSAATTTTLINTPTTLKVRDNFSPATAAERLIRVKVNAAP